MNRNEVIRMAREAGFSDFGIGVNQEKLDAFAGLVAAAEREACAKKCEFGATLAEGYAAPHPPSTWMRDCANAIRARGTDANT